MKRRERRALARARGKEARRGGPAVFEQHPFFRRRVQIANREAFFAYGPAKPLPGGTKEHRLSLYVWLPDRAPTERWYECHKTFHADAEAFDFIVAAHMDMAERELAMHATRVVGGLT